MSECLNLFCNDPEAKVVFIKRERTTKGWWTRYKCNKCGNYTSDFMFGCVDLSAFDKKNEK